MDEQIEQQIERNMDQEVNDETANSNFDFFIQLSDSKGQSLEYNNSMVKFNKHDILVDKRGVHAISNMEQVNIFHIPPERIRMLDKILGKGSAGTVSLAEYSPLNGGAELVAVKEIFVNQKQSRDQFIKELKALNHVENNNYIVNFYGCYYKNSFLYEVFEYMDMGSLRILLDFQMEQGMIPMEQILAEIALRILQALDFIHKKGQIHRDIKPENILINKKGELKITDFGIFKQLDEEGAGLASTYCGTPAYISPERVDGKYSFNTDIWSFGLVFYQLATNSFNPYLKRKEQSEYMYASRLKNDSPPEIFPHIHQRSQNLSHFLSRCLQKNPETRASAQELLNHPWLLENINKIKFKDYIRMVQKKMFQK